MRSGNENHQIVVSCLALPWVSSLKVFVSSHFQKVAVETEGELRETETPVELTAMSRS